MSPPPAPPPAPSSPHVRPPSQDLDQEDDLPLAGVNFHALEANHRYNTALKKQHDEFKAQVLYEQKGFCKEGGEGDGY